MRHLRRHDSEIVSLQWTLIEPEFNEKVKTGFKPEIVENETVQPENVIPKVATPSKRSASNSTTVKSVTPQSTPSKSETKNTPKLDQEEKNDKKEKRREPPKAIVDAGDMFDIHSYDYLEEEFGTISSCKSNWKPTRDNTSHKSTANNANFNFMEECQSLQEQIKAGNDSDFEGAQNQNSASNQSGVNMTDIRNMQRARASFLNESIELPDGADESDEVDELSNRSTIGSSHNTTEIAELEDEIKDLNINETSAKGTNGTVYLASGAQESYIVIWNPETGTILKQIQFKLQGRTKIPSK